MLKKSQDEVFEWQQKVNKLQNKIYHFLYERSKEKLIKPLSKDNETSRALFNIQRKIERFFYILPHIAGLKKDEEEKIRNDIVNKRNNILFSIKKLRENEKAINREEINNLIVQLEEINSIIIKYEKIYSKQEKEQRIEILKEND